MKSVSVDHTHTHTQYYPLPYCMMIIKWFLKVENSPSRLYRSACLDFSRTSEVSRKNIVL